MTTVMPIALPNLQQSPSSHLSNDSSEADDNVDDNMIMPSSSGISETNQSLPNKFDSDGDDEERRSAIVQDGDDDNDSNDENDDEEDDDSVETLRSDGGGDGDDGNSKENDSEDDVDYDDDDDDDSVATIRSEMTRDETDVPSLRDQVDKLEAQNKKLVDDKAKWIEKCSDQKEEIDCLKRQLKELKSGHSAAQAMMSLHQAEAEKSQHALVALQAELAETKQELAAATLCGGVVDGFGSSPAINSSMSSPNSTLSQRKIRESRISTASDLTTDQVTSIQTRNQNQNRLIQQLEKRLREIRHSFDGKIKELQNELKRERTRSQRLSQQSNHERTYRSTSGGTTFAGRDQSGGRKGKPKKTVSESFVPSSRDRRTSREIRESLQLRVDEAHAHRDEWKASQMDDYLDFTGDGGGDDDSYMAVPPTILTSTASAVSQISFIDAAVQKQQQKKGFWENLFTGDKSDSASEELTVDGVLSRDAVMDLKEQAKVIMEKEKILQRHALLEQQQQAKENIKQLKSAVKWGVFNMVPKDDDNSESKSEESSKRLMEEQELKQHAKENVHQLKSAVKWGMFNVFSQNKDSNSK